MVVAQTKREPLATVTEVAEYLGITPNALYVMRQRGTGPKSSKVGRTVRYRWADVEKWLDQQAGEEHCRRKS